MEKGEREVRKRKGRGGRRGEGEKGAMGVGDPTKFGKKSMPAFIRLYYFEYKNNRPIASRLRVKLPTSFKIDKLSLGLLRRK